MNFSTPATRLIWRAILPVVATVLAITAQAQLLFQFNYKDVGIGFNDPTMGAIRRSSFESAAGTLAGYIQTSTPVMVTLDVNSFVANNGFLATADSDPVSTGVGFQPTVAQQKILSGGVVDANGATADGSVFWNFIHSWDYTDSVQANAYDFKSTVMHELVHSLGFISRVDGAGRGWNLNASGTPDSYSTFDGFLVASDGMILVDSGTASFNTSKLGALTGNPGTYFGGVNAVAANGGNLVPLFSPAAFDLASSLHHLNDASFSNPDLLMESGVFKGPAPRALSGVELGILQDLGYTVVPEPTTLMLLGAGLAVGMRWGKRRQS